MMRMPDHVPRPKDGLWKMEREWYIDGGQTLVKRCQCPMAHWFRCKCQIRIFDGPSYMSLELLGEHNPDSLSQDKEKSKYLTV